MTQKKFTYYICCLDPKLEFKEKDFDVLYSGAELTEKQLKKLGMRFYKELPSPFEPYLIAGSSKVKDVLSYKKLGDLIYAFADSALTDIFLEDDEEELEEEKGVAEYHAYLCARIFSRIVEELVVVKKYNDEDKFKTVHPDILFNCYKQVLEEKGRELFGVDEDEEGYMLGENYDCIISFYQNIKEAMTKFDKAVLIFNDGEAWDVNKNGDTVRFGIKEEQDNIFKAKLSHRSSFAPISCILRVITNSKKGVDYFVEIYGFFAYRDENYQFIMENTNAEELKESYSFNHMTKQPLNHLDTDIYCDLSGERIMNF